MQSYPGRMSRGPATTNLLSAFVDQQTLAKMDQILQQHAYRTHEFGDSVFVEKSRNARIMDGAR